MTGVLQDPWSEIELLNSKLTASQGRIAQLEEALREITEYRPEWTSPSPDNDGCEDCARARERNWPPSNLCDTHYRELRRNNNQNEHNDATQHWALKDIARKALTATPSAASEVLRAAKRVVAGIDENDTHIFADGGDLEDLRAAYRKYQEGK